MVDRTTERNSQENIVETEGKTQVARDPEMQKHDLKQKIQIVNGRIREREYNKNETEYER